MQFKKNFPSSTLKRTYYSVDLNISSANYGFVNEYIKSNLFDSLINASTSLSIPSGLSLTKNTDSYTIKSMLFVYICKCRYL